MLQQVLGAYLAGDLPGALARCRELVRVRPGMAVSLLELGQLERESGHLEAAVQALSQALALDPRDTVTAALMAAYLTQAGRPQSAVALLRPYAREALPDVEVLTALALAEGRLGRTGEALAELERARRLEPGNAMLLVESGTVRLMAGDEAGARQAFEQALLRNPETARAHSSLGFLAAEAGRTQEALAHWRKALALDPRERTALAALVAYLRRHGRAQEAQVYLEQAGSQAGS